MNGAPLVDVRDLRVRFGAGRGEVTAVNGVSFSIEPGEVLGVLGESGSGKSVTLRALLAILPRGRAHVSGSIVVDGLDVGALSRRALSRYRGGTASMIFQEPGLALDPVYTVGAQIAEVVMRHTGAGRAAARARALEVLELVRIPSARSRLDAYPHELSGGMRQRAMIALALSCSPKLLLADEPTTALDATVQIQVILLLRELQRELGMAAVFVTHDVGVAAEVADRVAVMYAGRVVETGRAADILGSPRHPYTAGLLASTVLGAARGQRIEAIAGAPPDLARLPPGCAFAPRCSRRTAECEDAVPPLADLGGGRAAACIHVAGPAR